MELGNRQLANEILLGKSRPAYTNMWICILYASLIEFINANRYLSQYIPIQSPHTSTAILFCDIKKHNYGYHPWYIQYDTVHIIWITYLHWFLLYHEIHLHHFALQ